MSSRTRRASGASSPARRPDDPRDLQLLAFPGTEFWGKCSSVVGYRRGAEGRPVPRNRGKRVGFERDERVSKILGFSPQVFAAGAGCASPDCLDFRAKHTDKAPVAGKEAPCLAARDPETAPKAKREAERRCGRYERERPTFGLGDLDAEAQAAYCAYYAQDYVCLGYDIPPECASPEVLRWSHASCSALDPRPARAGTWEGTGR